VTVCLYTIPKYTKADSIYLRREKAKISGAGRTAINNRNSALMFERLVFGNFGPGDYYITFEYAPEHLPSVRRELLRDWRRFRRRLRDGGWPNLKYIYVPEHRHGAGRWHAHAILGGTGGMIELAAMEIEAAWSKGPVTVRPILDSFSEVGELARYLTKERPEVGDRGYIPSKGLRRPEIDSQRVADSTVLHVPPGGYVMDKQDVKNEYGEFNYIKYYLLEAGETAPMKYPKI
jgi:hypothetical protein